MKSSIIKFLFVTLTVISGLMACSKIEDELDALVPLLDDDEILEVVSSVPVSGATGISGDQTIYVLFNKTIDSNKCSAAFSISPSTTGSTRAAGNALEFNPDKDLSDGSYTYTISKDCEDLESRDLFREYSATFSVGPGSSPAVQAIGLESQSCPTTAPGSGSAVGGNHTLGSCWWDSSLSILSPTNYEFRGGDTGAGALGSPVDCADVNTDNIRIFFTSYMDPSTTISAISLTRQSPPATQIKIANFTWTDCNGSNPYGCKVVTIQFAELEASCNGTAAYGNLGTNGDFNLSCTTCPAAVADFPIYLLEVDTTARSTGGVNMDDTFSFSFEGN